ncbi:MAG: hypothetical protein AAGC68_16945 [Verrucomicrobiota bacterium]
MAGEGALVAEAVTVRKRGDWFARVSQVCCCGLDSGSEDELFRRHFDEVKELAVELSFGDANRAGNRGDAPFSRWGTTDFIYRAPGGVIGRQTASRTREGPRDSDYSFSLRPFNNGVLRREKPLETAGSIKEDFSVIYECLPCLHNNAITLDELFGDRVGITVSIGGSNYVGEECQAESTKECLVDMDESALVVLYKKTDFGERFEEGDKAGDFRGVENERGVSLRTHV